ncbi:phosphopantetheine-binding protein [Streptomyces massasporeus]|uniref:phosphopantetheine-binding protein n=1 Tax=Streptomyces massasporeus TaxID=67324 RepID=UPI0036F5D5D3
MSETAWPEQFEEVLRRCLPLLGPDTELTPDAELSHLGLDSLGTVALLVDLEETFDVSFPDQALKAETFGQAGALWSVLEGLRS